MKELLERPKIFEVGEWFYHGCRALQVEKRTRKGDEIFLWAQGQKYPIGECKSTYSDEDVLSATNLCELVETDIEVRACKETLSMVCTPDMKKEVWRRLTPSCRQKLTQSIQE